jgi:hypothetical protein
MQCGENVLLEGSSTGDPHEIVPTTVLVSSGVIETRWGGNMPEDFFHRFKQAFFPLADKKEGHDGRPVEPAPV